MTPARQKTLKSAAGKAQAANKKKITTTEVIAMFRGLNLPVTDDQNQVESKGDELEKLYLRRKNSPDAQQRNEADQWFEHLAKLKNNRAALLDIVEHHFGQLADTALEVALSAGISTLTPEVHAQLETVALSQCNCDAPLARRFVQDYLDKKGIGIEKNLVFPRLVERLTAHSTVGRVELAWTLPAEDCDEIVVRRFDKFSKKTGNGYSKKGKELCRGKRREFADDTVEPGKQYRYAVYSIWRGAESRTGVTVDVTAVGEVSGVRIAWEKDHVRVDWTAPSPGCKMYIFRSSSPLAPVKSGTPDPLPDSPDVQIVTSRETSPWHDRDAAPGTMYYYLVVAYFAPGYFSNGVPASIHTPIPPPAVSRVEAVFRDGAVDISWEKTRTAKTVDYVVVRSPGNRVPHEPEDGDVVQITRQTRCSDSSAEPGRRYTYTVFSRVGEDLYSRTGASSAPVDILADVTHLIAKSSDQAVELHWNTPPNTARVIVRRSLSPVSGPNGGEPVPLTGADHARDAGLTNGTLYHYFVCCAYRPLDTTELLSPGVRIQASPDCLPTPVADFNVVSREKDVICSWTPPRHGQVVVIRSSKEPGLPPGHRLDASQIDQMGQRVTVGKDTAVDSHADIDKPYYSVFAVAGTNAVFGGTGQGVVYPDVTGLQLIPAREGVILRWAWPEQCFNARILRRLGQWPEGPHDPAAVSIPVSRIDYKNAGEKYVDHIRRQSGDFYYIVYAKAHGLDRLFYSPGGHPGCKGTISWQPRMTIRYSLLPPQNKKQAGKEITLSWHFEEFDPGFAGFVLEAAHEGPPSGHSGGIELFHWAPGPGNPGPDYSAAVDLSPVHRRGWSRFYCKLKLVDPAARETTMVIHPNTCAPIPADGLFHKIPFALNGGHSRFTVPQTVVCPYCFDQFPVGRMLFDSVTGGEEQPAQYSLMDRLMNRPPRPPKNKKGKQLVRKLCPNNKHDLPFTAGLQESIVIGVIGAKFSGKSHYIAALIERLSGQVGQDFQAGLVPVTDQTAERYQSEFYEPLFGQGFELPVTSGSPPPLIYDLTFSGPRHGDKTGQSANRSVTLALYDTAGENLNDPETVRRMVKYLRVASGVIFLVDPLQSPQVRSDVPRTVSLPGIEKNAEPYAIISRVLTELENGKILTSSGPLSTPVAVALTKCDVLRDAGVIEPYRLWNSDARHVGYFDTRVHDDMNGMMEEYVRRWALQALNTVKARFYRHAFFGVSATGCASDPKTRRYRYISPWRVEDPLLWLLAQLGVIPVRDT